ncbi:Propionyl-CoA carboxylase alpha chain, mitochondrial [Nymphon striatum]|nr:Propionyl-CoA carboxylase alpha chain, mitochondrial [Nymphon striatum]
MASRHPGLCCLCQRKIFHSAKIMQTFCTFLLYPCWPSWQHKILIANRGEIACRVIKTARKMGIKTVAVYSDADRNALHVRMADEAVHIGPPPANQSYIVIDKIMAAIKETGAEAVHPGYGFLSENAKFAEALEAAGVAFIGPPKGAIEKMGDKITSKKIAQEAGVSTVPGHMGLIEDAAEAVKISQKIGYPNEAANSFGDDRIFIEKFVTQPRHIEIQVLCDSHGNGIYLGERECSIQRRQQKVIEEAPSPFLDEATRKAMGEQSVALATAVDYASAGTVEFIVDGDRNFYFLEMNTRLQVEHPVTELITGVDLVEQMIRVAYGEKLSMTQDDVTLTGWAMESRLYAEDPYRGFLPSIGRLTTYRPPSEISMYYDPMIAKLCTWAPTRSRGYRGNAAVYDHVKFTSGNMTTAFIEEEYPEGFGGVDISDEDIPRIAAACAAMHRVAEIRRTRVTGRMGNHERKVGAEWVVSIQGADHAISIDAEKSGANVTIDDKVLRVESNWTPGQPLARLMVDGTLLVMKVGKVSGGFRVRYRGADTKVHVRTPRQAELAMLMPVKLPPDTSKMLLCPMPGLVVSLDVAVGDEVQEGQALCTVEAMKMENILRAEKKSVVTKVNASAGDSLSVDDVIMEFE